MNIHLNKPYLILPIRNKRYSAHYHIPLEDVVVIPLRDLGDEVMCDIRWRNEDGEMQVRHQSMFVSANLIPLNPLIHEDLFRIWMRYYGEVKEPMSMN